MPGCLVLGRTTVGIKDNSRQKRFNGQADLDALECINSLTSNVTFLGDKQNFWKM